MMLDIPYNDAGTARQLMNETDMLTAQKSADFNNKSGYLRYCVMNKGNLLFNQM